MIPPLLAFFVWIPISLLFFRRYPIRVAILLNFIGGWAVLPAAHYAFSSDPDPYWILGNSLPTDYFLTKATVTGFTSCLASCFASGFVSILFGSASAIMVACSE